MFSWLKRGATPKSPPWATSGRPARRPTAVFLIKTGYDEAWSRLSPGLVLRADVLRRAIEEESLAAYDFLGGPDAYKLRWTSDVRARATVFGYRHPPGYVYRAAARPVLKRVATRLRQLRH